MNSTGGSGTVVALIVAGASVLSALCALAGVYLGRRWETRAERERAEIDRKIACYQGLIHQYFVLREDLREVATGEPDPEGTSPEVANTRRTGVAWNSAVFDVWLHGSKEVAHHVRQLDEQLNSMFDEARLAKYSASDWHDAREPVQRLMDGYLDVVRRELDLPPHKIMSDYKR